MQHKDVVVLVLRLDEVWSRLDSSQIAVLAHARFRAQTP